MNNFKYLIAIILLLLFAIASNAQSGEIKPATEENTVDNSNEKTEQVQDTENTQEDVAFLFNYKQLTRQTIRKTAIC